MRFLDHTQRRTTVGRTPLDEWSARRRDLYLTTHNTHKKQTSTPPEGFEPTVPASDRRTTPYTARPPGPTQKYLPYKNNKQCIATKLHITHFYVYFIQKMLWKLTDCFCLHVIVCHYINRSVFINLSFASVAGRWRSNPKQINTNATG